MSTWREREYKVLLIIRGGMCRLIDQCKVFDCIDLMWWIMFTVLCKVTIEILYRLITQRSKEKIDQFTPKCAVYMCST